MPTDSFPNLVDALRECRVLSRGQVEEVAGLQAAHHGIKSPAARTQRYLDTVERIRFLLPVGIFVHAGVDDRDLGAGPRILSAAEPVPRRGRVDQVEFRALMPPDHRNLDHGNHARCGPERLRLLLAGPDVDGIQQQFG